MLLPALVAVVCGLQSAAGARVSMGPAMAPITGATLPASDMSFIVTADSVKFKSETLIKLSGPSKAVPYFAGKRVSSMTLGAFSNSAPGSPLLSADGTWLDAPQALLYGANSGGNLSSIALTLRGVKYYNETGILKFNVTALPSSASLKLSGGPVGMAFQDSEQGIGKKLAPAVQANQTWTAVTLVVESTRAALKQPAETKTLGLLFGWGPWGWGGPGCGGWGCGCGGWGCG